MLPLEEVPVRAIPARTDFDSRAFKKQKPDGSREPGRVSAMLEKLFGGLLRVLTPLGPRYIKPSFGQRIYLLWIFRHFQVLPLQVLSRRQRRIIDALCEQPRFVGLSQEDGWDAPILGTLERRPPLENLPAPKSVSPASATHATAARG
jgi:hypothetical protein